MVVFFRQGNGIERAEIRRARDQVGVAGKGRGGQRRRQRHRRHLRAAGGLDAQRRVLEDDAALRFQPEALRRFEKEVGVGLAAQPVGGADDGLHPVADREAREGQRHVLRSRGGAHGEPRARRAGSRDERRGAGHQCQPLRCELAVQALLLVGHGHAFGRRGGGEHVGQDLVVRAPGGGSEEGVGIDGQAAPRVPGHPGIVVARHAVDQRAVEVKQEAAHAAHGLTRPASGSLR